MSSESSEHQFPWFALRVRSNFERVSGLHLNQRNFEAFLPSYAVKTRWSDRNRMTEKFLFPGYVFCRLNPSNRLPVLTTPGVVGVVSFNGVPAPIPESEIEAVRTMVRSGLLVAPWPFLQIGQSILIEQGPLAGMEGLLEQTKGAFRLVVSIRMLQRSISAEIDRQWVRPLKPNKTQELSPRREITFSQVPTR